MITQETFHPLDLAQTGIEAQRLCELLTDDLNMVETNSGRLMASSGSSASPASREITPGGVMPAEHEILNRAGLDPVPRRLILSAAKRSAGFSCLARGRN